MRCCCDDFFFHESDWFAEQVVVQEKTTSTRGSNLVTHLWFAQVRIYGFRSHFDLNFVVMMMVMMGMTTMMMMMLLLCWLAAGCRWEGETHETPTQEGKTWRRCEAHTHSQMHTQHTTHQTATDDSCNKRQEHWCSLSSPSLFRLTRFRQRAVAKNDGRGFPPSFSLGGEWEEVRDARRLEEKGEMMMMMMMMMMGRSSGCKSRREQCVCCVLSNPLHRREKNQLQVMR